MVVVRCECGADATNSPPQQPASCLRGEVISGDRFAERRDGALSCRLARFHTLAFRLDDGVFMMKRILVSVALLSFSSLSVSQEKERFEILGIGFGDEYGQVKTVLSEPSRGYSIEEWTGRLTFEGSQEYPAKISAVSTSPGGGRDHFSALFSSPPNEGKLVRAVRDVQFSSDAAPLADQFIEQLSGSFGPPSSRKSGRPGTNWDTLIWAKSPDGKLLSDARQAESCKVSSVYQAREMIALNYRLNPPTYCGMTMRVHISRNAMNNALISSFQVSLTDESRKRGFDAETGKLVADRNSQKRQQQATEAADRRVDF